MEWYNVILLVASLLLFLIVLGGSTPESDDGVLIFSFVFLCFLSVVLYIWAPPHVFFWPVGFLVGSSWFNWLSHSKKTKTNNNTCASASNSESKIRDRVIKNSGPTSVGRLNDEESKFMEWSNKLSRLSSQLLTKSIKAEEQLRAIDSRIHEFESRGRGDLVASLLRNKKDLLRFSEKSKNASIALKRKLYQDTIDYKSKMIACVVPDIPRLPVLSSLDTSDDLYRAKMLYARSIKTLSVSREKVVSMTDDLDHWAKNKAEEMGQAELFEQMAVKRVVKLHKYTDNLQFKIDSLHMVLTEIDSLIIMTGENDYVSFDEESRKSLDNDTERVLNSIEGAFPQEIYNEIGVENWLSGRGIDLLDKFLVECETSTKVVEDVNDFLSDFS